MSKKLLFAFIFLELLSFAHSINCHLGKDAGVNCDNSPITLRFYFDRRTNVCQPLFYRGCGGNENRFETREQCNNACVPKRPTKNDEESDEDDEEEDGKEKEAPKGKDMTLVVNVCKLITDAKLDEKAKKCNSGCPIGWKCTKKNYCCPMRDHICSLPASSGSERDIFKHYGRYAYQPGLKNCLRFSYFGVGGNYNNFVTYNDCKEYCMRK